MGRNLIKVSNMASAQKFLDIREYILGRKVTNVKILWKPLFLRLPLTAEYTYLGRNPTNAENMAKP